jgi:ribonuclease H2 subunit A
MTGDASKNNNAAAAVNVDQINDDVPASIYCTCRIALSCNKCGKPMKDRTATQQVVKALCENKRPELANVFGNGPLLLSDIPESAKADLSSTSPPPEISIGIDEAGRGSVLGPMVYGMAYWNTAMEATSIPKDFNDSKQLKEEDRERLFDVILNHQDIGFAVRSLLPSEISRNMLRTYPYNLNEMSHDSAMVMIRKLLDEGVTVRSAFIDTVGNPSSYKRKLEREFPGIDFIVESKADAKYAPCSAASVGR